MMNIQTEQFGEMQVTYPHDCGNAPKKVVLKDLTIAMAKLDRTFLNDTIADRVSWQIVGDRQIQGKEQVLELLEQWQTNKVLALNIDMIITHGKTASLNGRIQLEQNKHVDFCNVYLFTNASKQAKIKEITSYIIETS